MLPALASRGLRAFAPDLPGTGLSGRPVDFDYSWTGLGRHLVATADTLGLDKFHLVVHDIGGPVSFELATTMPERVASLTVLDTIVEPYGFRKPLPMKPFAYRGIGEIWLRATPRPAFRTMMRLIGLASQSTVTAAEIDVHHLLLRRDDDGRAFLKIMRGFETTTDKTALFAAVLAHGRPVQVLWGDSDRALPARKQGHKAALAAGLERPELLPGRHFLQEDCAEQIAERVATLAARSRDRS